MTTSAAPKPLHPAAYSAEILDVLDGMVRAEQRRLGREITVFDPLAGIGRIHRLARPGKVRTIGMEIEEPWAACHADTMCGDSIAWMEGATYQATTFDVICSSPPYGNRFSDSHNAQDGSRRRSYTHDLGRQLTDGNSGSMPYGPRYWAWSARLYRALPNVLADGGLLLWNVSDFVKGGAVVPAVTWHRGALMGVGFVDDKPPRLIDTRRMGYGENRDARVPSEVVLRMRLAT